MQDNNKAYLELLSEYQNQTNITSKKENGVLFLTLNRPTKYNSLSLDMYLSVAEVLTQANVDPEIKTVIFSGNGKHFCTGNDLTTFMMLAEKFPDFSENYQVFNYF